MSAGHILIVEDDKDVAQLLVCSLGKSGYKCTVTMTGEEAIHFLGKEDVDLILLDIILPGMDGFEVCKQVKQESRFAQIPIMIVTASDTEADRVVGFQLGAVDYVVKPFSMRELLLRIKAILNRVQEQERIRDRLVAGKLVVDLTRYQVSIDNGKIFPTQMELRLLVALMRRRGHVLSRDQLLDGTTNQGTRSVYQRTIDTHIKRLRKKLGKFQTMIETVRGVGYRLRDDE